MKNINNRKTGYNISDLFLERHSPRAMSGEEISKEELMTLFDAARWAPSSMNYQPWKFVYTMRGTAEFDKFFDLLFEGNQVWTRNASALIVVVSKNDFDDGKYSVSHSFDTGAAWASLAFQASMMGLVAHGMSGFNYEKAKKEIGLPDNYNVEAMIAVGRPGDINNLPEYLREFEKPNDRKELDRIICEGKFQI